MFDTSNFLTDPILSIITDPKPSIIQAGGWGDGETKWMIGTTTILYEQHGGVSIFQ